MPERSNSHHPYVSYTQIIECCDRITADVVAAGGVEELLRSDTEHHQRCFRAIRSDYITIGEAVRRLGELATLDDPGQPWSEIVGFRDALSHSYDGVNETAVREALAHIEILRTVCLKQRSRYDLNRPGFRAPDPHGA